MRICRTNFGIVTHTCILMTCKTTIGTKKLQAVNLATLFLGRRRHCMVQLLFGNRVALNPGLGDVSVVASANISHEQTQ